MSEEEVGERDAGSTGGGCQKERKGVWGNETEEEKER